MPKIKRQNLPQHLMDHLADRERSRQISAFSGISPAPALSPLF